MKPIPLNLTIDPNQLINLIREKTNRYGPKTIKLWVTKAECTFEVDRLIVHLPILYCINETHYFIQDNFGFTFINNSQKIKPVQNAFSRNPVKTFESFLTHTNSNVRELTKLFQNQPGTIFKVDEEYYKNLTELKKELQPLFPEYSFLKEEVKTLTLQKGCCKVRIPLNLVKENKETIKTKLKQGIANFKTTFGEFNSNLFTFSYLNSKYYGNELHIRCDLPGFQSRDNVRNTEDIKQLKINLKRIEDEKELILKVSHLIPERDRLLHLTSLLTSTAYSSEFGQINIDYLHQTLVKYLEKHK